MGLILQPNHKGQLEKLSDKHGYTLTPRGDPPVETRLYGTITYVIDVNNNRFCEFVGQKSPTRRAACID